MTDEKHRRRGALVTWTIAGAAFASGLLIGRGTATVPGEAASLRPGEHPVPAAAVRTGHFQVKVLAVTWPIRSLVGTHQDVEPHGSFVRVRVRIKNTDSTYHDFAAARQLLVTTGGRLRPRAETMTTARQPLFLSVGARDAAEFDLWFDAPEGSRPAAVGVAGDRDAGGALTGQANEPDEPVLVSLPPLPE